MAYREGLRRIRLIAKVLMLAGCSLLLVAVALSLRATLPNVRDPGPFLVICGAIGLYASVLGGIIALGAWIFEGFARPSTPPTP
jgi:hypothetical protein